MNSQRLDEIRGTLRQQREKLWEGAIKADPELFKRLAERVRLSTPAEDQGLDTLSAQREKLWESAIKADPELFFKAAEKAGLGDEIRPFADQTDRHTPSSYVTDEPTFSYAPR